MEGTVAGVRIVPPVVEFFDAETEVLHQMTLTVQNLSKSSRNIRYHGPATTVSTTIIILSSYTQWISFVAFEFINNNSCYLYINMVEH
jgi:hypothetical protein